MKSFKAALFWGVAALLLGLFVTAASARDLPPPGELKLRAASGIASPYQAYALQHMSITLLSAPIEHAITKVMEPWVARLDLRGLSTGLLFRTVE